MTGLSVKLVPMLRKTIGIGTGYRVSPTNMTCNGGITKSVPLTITTNLNMNFSFHPSALIALIARGKIRK